MELLALLRITATLAFVGFAGMIIQMCESLIWKPQRLRSKLRKNGIRGPPPAILLGNNGDMQKAKAKASTKSKHAEDQGEKQQQVITHNCSSFIRPIFDQWRKQYGSTFVFSLGNIQILHVTDPEVVKEITMCTSLDFGKPSYQQKEFGPILGQGILTSSGEAWAHQRKILAPELYMEKVKTMTSLMAESSMTLVNSLKSEIERQGGSVAHVNIDDYLRSFSQDVISRACFGSSHSNEEIFKKLRALQDALSKKTSSFGIPLIQHIPTNSNRKVWRLEKELRSLILNVVKERKGKTPEKDLLQMIMEGAGSSDLGQNATERFIVDNCKNIYLAGYETTAVSAAWTLMLLASNPEWQDKVRSEVHEVCGDQLPDADMIRKMKTLTMVIHESLRLYPPVYVMSREAMQDMTFGRIHVPKGVIVWTVNLTLHQDPEIWGPDANLFKPERFANGVTGACTFPHVYMPFGIGPRTCLGQNFAMTELKILIAIIVSNFSFTLSPEYVHSPTVRLVVQPEHGVDLLIKKL